MSCLLHKYVEVKNTGKHSYQECSQCGKRKIVTVSEYGYQPIDRQWLNKNLQGEKA
jgi:hypothetical protein